MAMSRSNAPTRVVFMGTPAFAVPSLEALWNAQAAQGWELVGVVTQPDRPAGRGRRLTMSPVKARALEYGVPILQPGRLRREPDAVEALRALAPDLFVVAAFGQILPPEVLAIPRFGSVNVHASLLPAHRGASPIPAAILAGDPETGVSIMLMDEGMDTGPVLAQAPEPIHPDDTAATLAERLARRGAHLLVETLAGWLRGEVSPVPQEELPGEPSVCRPLRKEAGRIDWTQPAEAIQRMVRAYTPWPSAHTTWKGRPFKILRARAVPGQAEPGRVVQVAEGIAVGTGEGLLVLEEVQPAGKRAMAIRDLLNGAPDFLGTRLGA